MILNVSDPATLPQLPGANSTVVTLKYVIVTCSLPEIAFPAHASSGSSDTPPEYGNPSDSLLEHNNFPILCLI